MNVSDGPYLNQILHAPSKASDDRDQLKGWRISLFLGSLAKKNSLFHLPSGGNRYLKQRVLTALRHETPDVVPCYDSLDDSHVIKVMGKKQCTTETKVACYKKLGFDGIPAKTKTFEKASKLDSKERLIVIDEWNRKYIYTEKHMKFYSNGVMTPEESLSFEWPDPENQERYNEIKEIVKLAGNELAVVGIVGGPFERSVLGFGLSRFLPMLLKRNSIVAKHMEKVRDYWIEAGKIEIEIGVDAIMVTDDYAYKHGPFFSPNLFKDTILPLLKAEVASFRKQGIPVIHHSDGDVTMLLPLLVDTGIDGIHSLEPSAGMDIGKVKKEYGRRLTLVGNIDSGNLLSFGVPRQVEEVVKETIAMAAPQGSYILSSSNSLHYGCRLGNIIAMLKAAKKYGKYPHLAKANEK
jgi:uroporphyrinogen decarboxylase